MSRHTLDDGKTLDTRITQAHYDQHWKGLAPPARLIGQFKRGEILWGEFAASFLQFLQQDKQQELLKRLVEMSFKNDVTILCIEEVPDQCHRKLIAQTCAQISPELEIVIR